MKIQFPKSVEKKFVLWIRDHDLPFLLPNWCSNSSFLYSDKNLVEGLLNDVKSLLCDRAQPYLIHFCCHGVQIKCFPDQIKAYTASSIHPHFTTQATSLIPLAHDNRRTEQKWFENITCSGPNTKEKMWWCCLKWKLISLIPACHLLPIMKSVSYWVQWMWFCVTDICFFLSFFL